jgi:hypothetical protein
MRYRIQDFTEVVLPVGAFLKPLIEDHDRCSLTVPVAAEFNNPIA